MTFREFHLAIMHDPVLGKLLPLEIRRTYPRLSMEGPALCAAFAGFKLIPGKNAVYPPVYYLKITYPQCTLYSFERLPAGAGPHAMTPRDPEDVKRLAELCDQALRRYDEKAGDLKEALTAYNALLDKLLEPEQLVVLDQSTARIGGT